MTAPEPYVRTGSGTPVTVFAHGLASSVHRTRPFGSGVHGTRIFPRLRGHAEPPESGTAPERAWSYAELAAELASVANVTGASRALGVSLGAGALLRLLTQAPVRFERVVIVLPAAVDQGYNAEQRARFESFAPLARAGDRNGLAGALVAELPAAQRTCQPVWEWAQEQAEFLVRPDLARALAELPALRPVPDRAELAACTAEVLVLGAEADVAHPVEVARQVADALPRAHLELVGPGGALWAHRARTRELIATFLNR